jgi:uncharacterized damage-inducible protein DinB
MSISEVVLPEWDQEMAGLRTTLERVPDDRMDFKPHAKSNTVNWLANHLANMPSWAAATVTTDGLDFTPDYKEPQGKTTAEILTIFDKAAAEGRAALASTSDEEWQKNWTLSAQGKEIFTMPRTTCVRSMVLNHMIHHRAQLTMYLRLMDVPVPGLYGPSADEGSFG